MPKFDNRLPPKQACPIPDLWSRIEDQILPHTNEGYPETDKPNLEKLLTELSDFELSPHLWSDNWEKKAWKYFPGEVRLVALTKQWLRQENSDPSWPYVWEPLFLTSPQDQELIDIALWWLENNGPRSRGAWTFIWLFLWDHGQAMERVFNLGLAWLDEFKQSQKEAKHNKYWWDVWDRLWESGIRPEELMEISKIRTSKDDGLKRPTAIPPGFRVPTSQLLPDVVWGEAVESAHSKSLRGS